MLHFRLRSLIPLLALTAAGCESCVTGPSEANIHGTWSFAWNSLTGTLQGVEVTCRAEMLFNMTQSGNTFSGTQGFPTTMTCYGLGSIVLEQPIQGETIVNGRVSANVVSFRLGSVNGPHSGNVGPLAMGGSGTWNVPRPGESTLLLTGEWTARSMLGAGMLRQP